MTSGFIHFTPCGLLLDACGVVLLGFSFFLKTTASMIQESGTTWDSTAYITVAENRSDGMFGTLLLLIGFIYQGLGYAGVESRPIVITTYVALLGFLTIYFAWLRRRLVGKWMRDIEKQIQ